MGTDQRTAIVLSARDDTKAAFDSVARNVDQLKSTFSALDGIAGRLPGVGAAITGALGTASLVGFVRMSIDAQAELHDLSIASKASVESLSAMQPAAKLAGVAIGDVAAMAGKLGQSLGEAKLKGGDKATLFKSLGIDPASVRDSGQALFELAKRLDDMPDKFKALEAARTLVGKSVSLPFLDELAQMERLIPRVTAAQAAAADQFNDDLIRLRSGAGELGIAMANAVLPSLNDILKYSLEVKKEWGALAAIVIGLGGGAVLSAFGVELDDTKRKAKETKDALNELAEARKRLADAERGSKLDWSDQSMPFSEWLRLKMKSTDSEAGNVAAARARTRAALKAEAAAFQKEVEDNYREYQRKQRRTGDMPDGLLASEKRDRFLDLMNEASGVNKDFAADLDVLYKGFLGGRVGLEGYVAAVENLIAKQPFAVKLAKDDVKTREDQIKVYERVAEAEARAQKAMEGFDASRAEALVGIQAQIDSIGKTADEVERIRELAAVERDLARAIEQVRAATEKTGDIEGEASRIYALTRKAAEERAKIDAEISRKVAAQQAYNANPLNGADKALTDYLRSVQNVAASTEEVVARSFKGMEDALVGWVKNGKLDLKSLVDYAETEFIRLTMIQPAISGAAKVVNEAGGFTGLLKGLFGGFKASGGPLEQGKWYVAGEYGPEPIWGGGPGAFATGYPTGGAQSPSISVVQHINIDSRSDQASIAQAMVAAKNAAVAAIHNSQRRGGAFA